MRLLVAMLLLFFVAPTCVQAEDVQSWNEVDLTASWRKVNFLLPLLARTDTRLPNPQLVATGITADLPLAWHLTLTGGYLFADLTQRSLAVHLPLVALSTQVQLGKFMVTDRNRFEKLVGYANSPIRYRNRLLVDRPFGRNDLWHFFADDEIFFDLSAPKWNQNRFQAGGGARINHHLSMDAYFLQRDVAGGSPKTRVIGTTLRIALTPDK